MYEGEAPVEMEGYYTHLISDRATDYVRTSGDAPFYMQVNYNSPHWPWEGPGDRSVGEEIERRYRENTVPFPLLHGDAGSLAKYGEMIESMDEGIGQILDALDETGKADDTIIVFASDNGGERYSFMWPFVGEKGDVTEGGIRVPFIVRWPAAIDPQQWTDAPHQTTDWTATMLDVAGAPAAEDHLLDGFSLLPWLVDGADHPGHDLFWRISSQGALRRGKYKYLVDCRDRARLSNWPRYPAHVHQLFDLSGDAREHADIARHHPELVASMRAEWERINDTLLPYPDDHPGVPRHARPGQPAVSSAD